MAADRTPGARPARAKAPVLCYHSGSMDSRRRLLYYILLNVFVSALVSGTILLVYDRIYRTNCATTLPATTPAQDGIRAEIISIAGAGTAPSEIVTIINDGSGSLILTGWYLRDAQGQTYTFPQVTLHPGAPLKVHTTAGQDTAGDLFWGRSSPVWTSGELAALYDAQNVARAFYRVP